jgi:hypothetical protein
MGVACAQANLDGMDAVEVKSTARPTTTPHQLRFFFKPYKTNKPASLTSLPHTYSLPSPLKTAPFSGYFAARLCTSTCPALLGLLHSYASFRTLKACVADQAHGSPRTPPSLHQLLSPLGEARPHNLAILLRSLSRPSPSMLQRASDC